MKHVISQQYKNWDLNINFETDKWGVDLVGFLFSSEYEEINKKIAREGASLPEIIDAITSKPGLQPTASLDKDRVAKQYGMSAEEAEVIKSLIRVIELILFFYRKSFHWQRSTKTMVLFNLFQWYQCSLRGQLPGQMRRCFSEGDLWNWQRSWTVKYSGRMLL